jgi:hypothetical protein
MGQFFGLLVELVLLVLDSELLHVDSLRAFESLYLVASAFECLLSFQLDAIELSSALYP